MKRIFALIVLSSFILATTALFAQTEITLWPNGAPNDNGLGTDDNNVPTLTVYHPSTPNGMAIIACPGGAYVHLAMDHEGHSMAGWMNSQGITYAVLKYRFPNGHREVPLSDAEQAIRMVRDSADAWGLNPNKVGIMGSSAGGHLASTLSTHYSSQATRPDFQILLYPVISMEEAITHATSRRALIGPNPTQELIDLYSNDKQVNAQTPPAFITLSSDDTAVPPLNTINYYTALQRNNVPACINIFPYGGHGWGFRDTFPYKREWTATLEKWLREQL